MFFIELNVQKPGLPGLCHSVKTSDEIELFR